jgi:putative lipoic acid-binding regulatory protein
MTRMESFDDPKELAVRPREETDSIPATPIEGHELAFPVTFDLRVIYVLAEGTTIIEDLERLYLGLGVPCSLIQGIAKPGAKYGRMGSRITLSSREQMYALYAEIGKLSYVKTAI